MKITDIEQIGMDPQRWRAFKDQVLICLVRRLGGTVVIKVDEVDSTGSYIMTLEVNNDTREFTFVAKGKH